MSHLSSINFSLDELPRAVQQFWEIAQAYRHIAFSGGLGAGKTTFIHALCDHLGVTDAVSSPTFALINEYRFPSAQQEEVIFHMDWYRLRSAEEAIHAGMEDCLRQPGAYCFVEWPEQAPELLQSPYLWASLVPEGPQARILQIEAR